MKAAKDAVTALESDQATTTEQLNAAKTALNAAQQAVDKAQADVTQAKKDIATAQGQISGIQDGITDLTSRITTAETGIEQNSQAIALRATKTEVNTAIQGAKDYTDAQLKVEAGKITQSVNSVSTKVDKLTSQKQETYYYQSTSNTTQTGGSWSTTKPSEASGKYIWMKIKFTFVDGTTSETSPICMTGATGAPGSPGATGKGVKSTAITYQSGTSGTTAPTGSWNATVPAVSQGQYLWTRTILTYTDNTTSTSYSVSYIPKNGTNGTNGTSVTVSSTSVTYQKSSSGTTAPTGTWVNSPPATNAGEYLWTKTVVNYSDGKSTTAYSVSRNGTNGTNGTSVTVKSTAVTYQAGASGTTVPTGTWLTTIPTVPVGQFLWTKTVVTYSDNKSTTSYSVSRQGTDGVDAFMIVYDSPSGLEFSDTVKSIAITAKVFKGGKELTDAQVNAFGAIKWYQVGVDAAIATGKTLTLTAPKEVYATLEN
ncbi:hypothetical protein [Dubosiella newyorkensis]|uniref:coiled-coil domain-containing protein n=1 Tax=Dubosiella newyorkensis TaxID=1862672 RepID=UPI00272ABD11|nr:hypothetical protein [Dubosiella newyorkensis]